VLAEKLKSKLTTAKLNLSIIAHFHKRISKKTEYVGRNGGDKSFGGMYLYHSFGPDGFGLSF
jgi:hypothetical protein